MADFKTGHFESYRFTATIHLGAIQQDIPKDTVVEFDGSTMKWAGRDYAVPQLRAGINAGWLVEAADQVSTYKPRPAGVRVRPAQAAGENRGEEMHMEQASEEEEVVSTVAQSQERRDKINEKVLTMNPRQATHNPVVTQQPKALPVDSLPESTQTPVTSSEEIPTEIEYTKPSPPPTPTTEPVAKEGRQMKVLTSEDQEAETVGRIKTPAKQRTVIDDGSKVAREVSRLDNSLSRVERVASENSQSITEPGPHGTTGDVSEVRSGDELSELLPDAATPTSSPLVWDRKVHWKTRVQKAVAEYGDNPVAMRQILAQETPNVAKHMRSQLSRAGKSID